MSKIHIQVKDLDTPFIATVAPGEALLIGRAPDPTGIDWSLLPPQQPLSAGTNPGSDPARYKCTQLVVPSPRVSANHLLVLHNGPTLALYDLNSRNGSWVKLEQHSPIVTAESLEVSLSLAGPPAQERRVTRPANAEWTTTEDFGSSINRALSAWLASYDTTVQCVLGAAGSEVGAFPLADGKEIAVRLLGTSSVDAKALQEMVGQYVHDQNARFMQLERRVSGMVASSAAIRQILFRLADAAASGRRVILLGPTGVGKELLARSYHCYSPRSGGPFVTVNCALLEKDLLHAQLFGARRGSFTGAVADVTGLIEAANNGTLFLDELGEMSVDVQKALLRFLDSRGEYYRLGDSRPRLADVQIVCATNVSLDDPACRGKRFRDDLWYRLASAVIKVPPLHERPDDILAFLRSRTLPGNPLRIAECLTEDALAFVLRDPWPGNFRDLENFTERLPVAARLREIDLAACKRVLKEGRASDDSQVPLRGPSPSASAVSLASAAGGKPTPLATSPTKRALDSLLAAPAQARTDTQVGSNATLDWERIAGNAVSAFLKDHGEARVGWEQLQLLIERYLKPVFLAHATVAHQRGQAGGATNYSALARQLNIADGTTVKTHLVRFEERFVIMEGAGDRSGTELS